MVRAICSKPLPSQVPAKEIRLAIEENAAVSVEMIEENAAAAASLLEEIETVEKIEMVETETETETIEEATATTAAAVIEEKNN